MDYSKLSDEELQAIADNDYSKLSDETLKQLANQSMPAKEDKSKYEGYPISTFAANALNTLTFGLPDYINKKYFPETYAEGEKYKEANPGMAQAGEVAGEVAGLAAPAALGAWKGAQYGARGINFLANKFAPSLTGTGAELARLYGGAAGAHTGLTMGAQTGAALPGVVRGNPAEAAAKAELVNQMAPSVPGLNPLGGATGHIVPAVAGAAAGGIQGSRENFANSDRSLTINPRYTTRTNAGNQPAPAGPVAPPQNTPVTMPTGGIGLPARPSTQMNPAEMTQYIALQKLLDTQRRQNRLQ